MKYKYNKKVNRLMNSNRTKDIILIGLITVLLALSLLIALALFFNYILAPLLNILFTVIIGGVEL